MELCAQAMKNPCIYSEALDYFIAEVFLLKYLMFPPVDFYAIVPAAQVEEFYSEYKDDMLISTCTTHQTVNDVGVESML